MTDIDELVTEARSSSALLRARPWAVDSPDLIIRLVAALEAERNRAHGKEYVEAERDEAARLSHHFRNERDRYRSAIEQALQPQNIDYGHIDIALSRVHDILSDALNLPEIVLSYTEVEDMR